MGDESVECPVCSKDVSLRLINAHLDNGCKSPTTDAGTDLEPRSFFLATQPPPPIAGRGAKRKLDDAMATNAAPASPPATSPLTNIPATTTAAGTSTATSASPRGKTLPRGKEALAQIAPLAERMRPTTLDDFVGQESLVGKGGLLRGLIEQGRLPSMILWGGSGTGKTTLARIMARSVAPPGTSTSDPHEFVFRELSAATNNVADCKKTFDEATNLLRLTGQRTLVFLDEVHRFTKAQQDVFLPYVERGTITLVAATTENPSFRINNALVSRCRVFVLNKLTQENLTEVLTRAARRIDAAVPVDVLGYLAGVADGDARQALYLLELVATLYGGDLPEPGLDTIRTHLRRTTFAYDRNGDAHYDLISALHKSIRGSDGDAALYWCVRMVESGEDPLYICRRLVRVAVEDVGLADPQALVIATAAYTAVQQVGMPEADACIAQAAVYLAHAPKSVTLYKAIKRVKSLLRDPVAGAATAEVPMHLRNAPTALMKRLGHGKGYKYTPDYAGDDAEQQFLPDALVGKRFLYPAENEDNRDDNDERRDDAEDKEEPQLYSELDDNGERML
ncbi:DNA-dependent ATPase mgs1 [Savitreella phatthalungensis]